MGIPIIEGSNTTKTQALTDILASIALEEAAVGHILNAEGEKLQRVIHTEQAATQDLLAINQSVDNLADTLTNLVMLIKSKTNLVLRDNCYSNVCDAVEPTNRLILTSTDGSLTPRPNTINEYDLVVDTNNTFAPSPSSVKVTLSTIPPTLISIASISATGVIATALLNVITIAPNPTYQGTVTAKVSFGESEQTIIIHVTQSAPPCSSYTLSFLTTNGNLTSTPPYVFTPGNTTDFSEIQIITNPASTVSISNLTFDGGIYVSIIPNDTLHIEYQGDFTSGKLSADVNFGDSCSRHIIMDVILPCSLVAITPTSSFGTLEPIIGQVNHYSWTFPAANTGDEVTISTNPVLTVQLDKNLSFTTINPDLIYTEGAIVYLFNDFGTLSGTVAIDVTFDDSCTTTLYFNVSTVA